MWVAESAMGKVRMEDGRDGGDERSMKDGGKGG